MERKSAVLKRNYRKKTEVGKMEEQEDSVVTPRTSSILDPSTSDTDLRFGGDLDLRNIDPGEPPVKKSRPLGTSSANIMDEYSLHFNFYISTKFKIVVLVATDLFECRIGMLCIVISPVHFSSDKKKSQILTFELFYMCCTYLFRYEKLCVLGYFLRIWFSFFCIDFHIANL